MKSRVYFDVACNDPDNGLFDGRVAMISYGDIDIEAKNWPGYRFTEGAGFIRLHRFKFRTRGSKDWVGNWCWNRYWLERAEAKRFLAMLRSSGRWRCTQAPCRFYDWFNREGRFVPPKEEAYVPH